MLDFLIAETGHHERGAGGFSGLGGLSQARVVALALGQRHVVIRGDDHCSIREAFTESPRRMWYVAGVKGRDECDLALFSQVSPRIELFECCGSGVTLGHHDGTRL